MAAKRGWSDYPADMARKVATGKALEALPKRKRARRAKSPFVAQAPRSPTRRQKEFLRAVADLTANLGRAPSAGELGEHMGISRLGARGQLLRLAERGLLRDVPVVVSSGQWALTDAGTAELDGED